MTQPPAATSLACILLAACTATLKAGPPAADSGAVRKLADEVRGEGWIAFSAPSEKGDWEVYLCRPDGSERRNITNTPDSNEFAPQFSRDGTRLLYRRVPRKEKIDGNDYGTQGELVFASSDGSGPRAFGGEGEFPWASWSPDGKQIACLSIGGVEIVDIATKKTVRKFERKGFFQQMTWSPDGKWLSGVANSFGTSWSIAKMDAATGEISAVHRVDCCTPNWFPDSKRIVFSWRPGDQRTTNNGYGWTQLWWADADGKERHLIYREEGRHVYGGHISPDGLYVLFTGNLQEDGNPGGGGAPMALMRLSDAGVKDAPVITLPTGWAPNWTYSDVLKGK